MNELKRCPGHGAGPSGHQHREGCSDCLRRVAPRAGDVPWMDAPEAYPCPSRIPYDERIPLLTQIRRAA